MSLSNLLRGLFVCLGVVLVATLGAWGWPVDVTRPAAAAQPSPTPADESQQTNNEAEALLALSVQQNAENHALAVQTAQQALALWQAAGDNVGMARAYAHIGQYCMAQSSLPEAIENYEKALQLWRDLNNPSQQASTLIMLGFIEARQEEWSNSISFLTQARDLIDQENDPFRMGQIEAGYADIFNESGMPEAGLLHFERALNYFRQTPNTRDDMRITLQLGVASFLLGNHPQALTYMQEALANVEADIPLDAASCNHQIGRVYVATGEHEAALQHLQSALTIYVQAGNPVEEAQVLALMGQVYQQQGKMKPARQKYLQALSIFDRLSDRVNQATVHYALGRLELQAHDYAAAESYLKQSIDFTEDIRRIPASSELIAAFSARVHERYEAYIECLMRQRDGQSGPELVVRAFESSELGRSRSLAELLRATGTKLSPELDPALAAEEKSLRQSLRVKQDYKVALLSRRGYKKESLDELDKELAQLETDYKRVTETIRARCPSCQRITRPVAWTLAQIQQEVIADDETILLEYSLGKEASYVWAVTRDKITSYELPAQARIDGAAQKVHRLLSVPPGTEPVDELSPAIRELSQMILAPVAAELKKRRIIVVADRTLNYIPFQVLQASPTNGEPLVANYEIINAPSATILGELRQEAARRQPAPKMLAAFGNPMFAQHKDASVNEQSVGDEFAEGRLLSALRDTELNRDTFDPSVLRPLFYAKRELANLRALAAGEDVFVATDFAATREQLLGIDLTQFEILHFATHGLLNARRPENSGLVLSTVGRDGQALNGFVGLHDIYSLRAPVDLVVLSACQTALGKDVRGEGLVGLTRGFMYAGASSVAATLWKVEDRATAELMKQFYAKLLQEGMPPGAAMRAAQNNIRQRPYWRSPYYWAAFTLQGEYRQTIKLKHSDGSPRLRIAAAGGAGLAMLLLVAAWWYRRRRTQSARNGVR